MRRGRRVIIGAACAAGLVLPTTAGAQTAEPGHLPPDCFEPVPAAVAATTGDPIDVHIHVVLDAGVGLERARAVMDRAAVAYEPLGIRLVPSFARADFATDDVDELLVALKKLFGGKRPPWAHVVYLLTTRDIAQDSATGPNTGVAGKADCIGGVAFPESSFVVGEAQEDSTTGIAPFTWFREDTAKIAAHEIGHLFGAHHHYANCAQGVPDEPTDVSPCTLMFNDVAFMSLRFSSLNAAIVRGHAEAYLEPVTAPAPPDGSVAVPPAPTSAPAPPPCDLRAYQDPSGDHANLGFNNPDDADLLGGTFVTEAVGGREVTRFRWKLASLDGEFSPGAKAVLYHLHITGPTPTVIIATWDGQNPPTAAAYKPDSSYAPTEKIADLTAGIQPGPGGVIEVELPLERLGLAGEPISLGRIWAPTDFDDKIDFDSADPMVPAVRPGLCASEPARRAAPGGGAGATGAGGAKGGAAMLGVALVDRSARRANRSHRLRVRLRGAVTDAHLRLADATGRVVGQAKVARVAGRRVVTLRITRRLRPGRYALVFAGRTAGGGAVSGRSAVTLRR
jgi:hypothetical protein